MKNRKFLDSGFSAIKWNVPKPSNKTFYYDCFIDLDITDGHRMIDWCLEVDTKKERKKTLEFLRSMHTEISGLYESFVRMIPAYEKAEKRDKERRKKQAAKNKKKK